MADKEETSVDQIKQKANTLPGETTVLDKKPKNKQGFPKYLKMVARKSRAGFDRVHHELLGKYGESSMREKTPRSRASFRQNLLSRGSKWSSSLPFSDIESFRSYIDQNEENDSRNRAIRHAFSESEACLKEKSCSYSDVCSEVKNRDDNKAENQYCDTALRPVHIQYQPESAKQKVVTVTQTSDLKKTATSNKTIDDVVYDVPPLPTPHKTTENLNISMKHSLSLGSNKDDHYSVIDESFDTQTDETVCGDYVNLQSDINRKASEGNDTVVVYSSTQIHDSDIGYAKVNKQNKHALKGGKTEHLPDKANDDDEYEYVPCDEFVAKMLSTKQQQYLDPQKPHLAFAANQTKAGQRNAAPDTGAIETGDYITMTNGMKPDFYTFSVEEVAAVMNTCAMPDIAKICEREQLDGEYFRSITNEELCGEPFKMNWFHVCKLYRVINGWRPKHSTVKMQ